LFTSSFEDLRPNLHVPKLRESPKSHSHSAIRGTGDSDFVFHWSERMAMPLVGFTPVTVNEYLAWDSAW
jgi:hypothetical protein